MPIVDGMGLVFAVTSYDGRIVISPTSCRDLMPDPEAFTQCIRDSFQEYLSIAAERPKAVPRPRRIKPAAPAARKRSTVKSRRAVPPPRAGAARRAIAG